ncbi:MAG: MBL fold metallo-hydrolase [Acidimicrobiia bacterium]|nr:MBL fold metallo-hydrolase [Acidimicrobiia bacterium]
MDERFYFRQLLSGVDFAIGDELARQMRNFVYLIGDREASEAFVIDPAYDPAGIVDLCNADGMRLTGVLATHYHPDHVGGSMMGLSIPGIAELLELVDVPVHVQADELAYVSTVTGLGPPELRSHSGGDVVSVGGLEIELLHTPGHTPGSQCFLVGGWLLSGDTLFLEGCGRTDLPGGDPAAMYESLTRRLERVPDDTVLFPGHYYAADPSASLGQTRRSNYVFKPRNAAEWLAMFGS